MESEEDKVAYLIVKMSTYCYIVFNSWLFMCDLPIFGLSFPLPESSYMHLGNLLPSLIHMYGDPKIMFTINLLQIHLAKQT